MRILTVMLFLLGQILSTQANTNTLPTTETKITTIHQQFKQETLTSEQLVKHYLARIKQHDKQGAALNAVSQINPHALTRAKVLDKQFKQHGLTGPLHGIPVLLKDNIDTTDDMSNSAGSLALKEHFPANNAFLVKQLLNAGAIILGKTNLSEWANFRSTSSSSGWSSMYGQTKNAHDVTRSPCGSSSGSGVAIAADFAVLAVGTETDGSVTCPAAINGIVGIKPTLGTVSRSGIIPIAHSQDTAGPMAQTVSDAVIMLSAMTAIDKHDPAPVASTVDYVKHLKKDGLAGKRIGVVRNLMGYHNKLDSTFEQAIKDLRAQGAIIIDDITFETKDTWGGNEFEVLLYEFKADLNSYLANTSKGLPKSLGAIIEFNQKNAEEVMPHFAQEIMQMAQSKAALTAQDYLTALKSAKQATQKDGIDKLLNDHKLDLLVAPTTGPAWKIDHVNGDHYLGAASSAPAIAGYPHITVPMGFVKHLPVGISFIGGFLQEGTLIEAAYSYEQATQHRRDPVQLK
ncbi:amidase [Thalassotalea sp. PP2-459]|uniref:amidase n=1 Tax=Thalassotalea sp. PP2-459 TaxID=1742724 RepID=UPI000944BBA5|nr:amidase [Thalassotalea sp. PP2-459]OKY24893.1 amidase [Thalassotalea sp. PP2-459]